MIINDPFLKKMRAEWENDGFSMQMGIVSDRGSEI